MFKLNLTIFLISISAFCDNNLSSFEDRPNINECVMVLEAAGNQVSAFDAHTITKCERQIVNGNNYRLTLVDPDHTIKKCKMVLHQTFDKLETKALKNREGDQDCFTLLEAENVTEESL